MMPSRRTNGIWAAVRQFLLLACLLLCSWPKSQVQASERPFVQVSKDHRGFVLDPSSRPFVPFGFNYDHDDQGRLLEDYWETEWPKVEAHFAQMKKLGANVVRIHLQFGKFMEAPGRPNEKALKRLAELVHLAEAVGLYLDLTGLGCYDKADVPVWYDKLSEAERWDVQAHFWEAVAARCAKSPAIFCYDLMNEPVVPGGRRRNGDWLGSPFAGKHFVQFITLDQGDRARPVVAQQWVHHLTQAIRKQDRHHLITVGLVEWSLDRPGLTSGFVPDKIAANLDFISVHLCPEKGKVNEALKTLAGFSVGKPVVIEETFPLKCSLEELGQFIERSKTHAAGWIGFYWGKPPEELRKSKAISDTMMLAWLEYFEGKARALSAKAEDANRPAIKKLGTIDLLMVETTPVVFNDRLYRFEYVRENYPGNKTGTSYFRFIDVVTGKATPAFAKGKHLGCAFVEGDTAYGFGMNRWGGSKITVFRSKDLNEWQSQPALTLPGWGLYNTSVCKADGRYVMAVEVGEPKEVVGVPFTIFFAESKDLLTWKLLPLECVYSKEKYTACPALRWLDGYFYMIYLEARPGPTYESHIVRSKDMRRWESSRLNPVLAFSEDDKRIANSKLTPDQRKAIAQARDINNSDVDLCEFNGKTMIYYSWGNQQGKEFLAEAVYEGTLASFLKGWFP
jgi:hypothetical protein